MQLVVGLFKCTVELRIFSRAAFDGLMYYDIDEKKRWERINHCSDGRGSKLKRREIGPE